MLPTVPAQDWASVFRQPFQQIRYIAPVVFGILLLMGLVSWAGGSVDERTPYQILATGMMFFGVANALLSPGTDNVNRYWLRSFASYAALLVVGMLLARLVTGFWPGEVGSYRGILTVLTFCYLVLLSIMSAIRAIVGFAENEKWSQPRKKN